MTMVRQLLGAVNILTGLVLIALSIAYFQDSTIVAALLLIASVDQFVDAYLFMTGRELRPRVLLGLDLAADILQVLIGLAALLMGISYVSRLQDTLLAYLLAAVGALMLVTSVVEYMLPTTGGPVLIRTSASLTRGRRGIRRIATR